MARVEKRERFFFGERLRQEAGQAGRADGVEGGGVEAFVFVEVVAEGAHAGEVAREGAGGDAGGSAVGEEGAQGGDGKGVGERCFAVVGLEEGEELGGVLGVGGEGGGAEAFFHGEESQPGGDVGVEGGGSEGSEAAGLLGEGVGGGHVRASHAGVVGSRPFSPEEGKFCPLFRQSCSNFSKPASVRG